MPIWELRRERGAICLSIFQGQSEIVLVNPRGDFDNATERDVACGLVCMPEMHRYVKRRAEAGDTEASALIARIEREAVTAQLMLAAVEEEQDEAEEQRDAEAAHGARVTEWKNEPEPDPDRWHDERHEREEARRDRQRDDIDDIAF